MPGFSSVDSIRPIVFSSIRWPLVIVICAGLLLLASTFGSLWLWVLTPETTPASEVAPADAVVIFVGGRGERLHTARELLDAGVADTLVIPNGLEADDRSLRRSCRDARRFEVLCPATTSIDTGGEARAIAVLARERGWDRLVMVTSNYHVARARLRLERCFEGDIEAVDAGTWSTRRQLVRNVVREWFGHVEARTIERSC